MILTEVYGLTRERLHGNNDRCLNNSDKYFKQEWVLAHSQVFWGSVFQITQCSPYCIILTEIHVLTHERLREADGKCLGNLRQSVIFKMRYIMQLSFLRLWVSIVLVFFVLHDFDIILCVNVRMVAQKTTVTVRDTEGSQFFSNWDLSCTWVFWGSVFQMF